MRTGRPALVGFAFLLVPFALAGQRVSEILLKPANGKVAGEFSSIAMVRELADHRVIVLDTAGNKLLLADFATRAASPLGRTGEGPQEYRRPRELFALPGDSTVVADVRLRRWILFAGVRPVATLSAETPVVSNGEGYLRGVDAMGRAALVFTARNLGRAMDRGDSLYLVRLARGTGRGDTVARMLSPFGGPPGSATRNTPQGEAAARPGAGERRFMMAPPISDQAILFPDGWLAVARVDPYRVDWVDPAGVIHVGAALPVPVTPLNDKEKRAYLARLSERDGKPAGNPADITNWIPEIPPFWGLLTSLFTAPDGSVVIARVPTAAEPQPRYDIVDRRGVFRGRLNLKGGERIVGFGPRSLYTAALDDDGVEELRRYPWP